MFGSKTFFRLWTAQFVSSLGDWIGLIAILAIAARVSDNSGAAVSLVMTTRVLPGFLLGTVGGVIIDRFDRRKVMVLCDIGRASLLLLLPFVDSLGGLLLISLGLEILTLLWGPAQAATVPNIVDEEHLSSANSLSLAASYGTFPIAAIIFSLLAGRGHRHRRLRHHLVVQGRPGSAGAHLRRDDVPRVGDHRLPAPDPASRASARDDKRIDWTETFREIKEGLQFVGQHALVRGVMLGLGVGLIGAGAMIPLGPSFAEEVLDGGAAAFGVLMTALGFGAAIGVVTLLWFQGRLPRVTVFCFAVIGTGGFLVLAASFSALAPAALMIGVRRRVRGHHLRHRLHRAAGERARRAARPHLRDALHGRAALPADLAHHLAVVGRLLGLGHAGDPGHRPVDRRSVRTRTRSPACASRCGAVGSSRSSPGSSPGGRSARRSGVAAASRRAAGVDEGPLEFDPPLGLVEPSPDRRADDEPTSRGTRRRRRRDDRGTPDAGAAT